MVEVLKGDPLARDFNDGPVRHLRLVAKDLMKAQAILGGAPEELLIDATAQSAAEHYQALRGPDPDMASALEQEKTHLETILSSQARATAVFRAVEMADLN